MTDPEDEQEGYIRDPYQEWADGELLKEYDAFPENFRPVIDTPRTDAAEKECRETLGCINLVYRDDMADLERSNFLLRRHRNEFAEACRWAQAQLGKHTRPSPIDRALALLKQLP